MFWNLFQVFFKLCLSLYSCKKMNLSYKSYLEKIYKNCARAII